MVIRAFQPSDAPALWRVFYSAIHDIAAADYTPEQIAAWAPADRDIAQWQLRMEGIKPFVAEIDGQIAGYADLQADGYLDHFYVAAAFARQGVGSALMRRILEQADARRLDRLYSQVSITARPFFARFGFQVEATQQISVRGVLLNNFRMVRDNARIEWRYGNGR